MVNEALLVDDPDRIWFLTDVISCTAASGVATEEEITQHNKNLYSAIKSNQYNYSVALYKK